MTARRRAAIRASPEDLAGKRLRELFLALDARDPDDRHAFGGAAIPMHSDESGEIRREIHRLRMLWPTAWASIVTDAAMDRMRYGTHHREAFRHYQDDNNGLGDEADELAANNRPLAFGVPLIDREADDRIGPLKLESEE